MPSHEPSNSANLRIDAWGFPIPGKDGKFLTKPAKPRVDRVGPRVEKQLVILRRLCAQERAGHPMSARRIARELGVDHETIRQIELGALKKLRRHLGKGTRTILQELLESHLPSQK